MSISRSARPSPTLVPFSFLSHPFSHGALGLDNYVILGRVLKYFVERHARKNKGFSTGYKLFKLVPEGKTTRPLHAPYPGNVLSQVFRGQFDKGTIVCCRSHQFSVRHIYLEFIVDAPNFIM